jgi:acetoin utilization deacetylase AcuC-like enzyme
VTVHSAGCHLVKCRSAFNLSSISFQFDPELVLVASGFDAAVNDPLGKCKVSPEMYGHMTHHLQALANGKVIEDVDTFDLNDICTRK